MPRRIQIRSVMIVIAVLAVIMAMFRFLVFYERIYDVSVMIEGSNVRIVLHLLPSQIFIPPTGRGFDYPRVDIRFSLWALAAFVAIVVAFLAVLVIFRLARWRVGSPISPSVRGSALVDPNAGATKGA